MDALRLVRGANGWTTLDSTAAASCAFHGVEAARDSFISLPPTVKIDEKANYKDRKIRRDGFRQLGSWACTGGCCSGFGYRRQSMYCRFVSAFL